MTITVSSGVTSSGLTISAGDELVVLQGGAVESSTILSGGVERISSGGSATATIVLGGKEDVYAGGSASGDILSAGGIAYV